MVDAKEPLSEVMRWLELDRDVCVVGDTGVGKSRLLNETSKLAVDSGIHTVFIRGSKTLTSKFPAVFMHELMPIKATWTNSMVREAADIFGEELQGAKNLIIIDDADLLDEVSLVVLSCLLDSTNSSVLLSAIDTQMVDRILMRRGPAQVEVVTMGFVELAGLISKKLGGNAEVSLISELLIRSGGNPAALLALLDSFLWSEVISQVDGLWAATGNLELAPQDSIERIFLVGKTQPLRMPLSIISLLGPLKRADAEVLTSAKDIRELEDLRRLSFFEIEGEEYINVVPPSLANALRQNLNRRQIARVEGKARRHFGTSYDLPQIDQVVASLSDQLSRVILSPESEDLWATATAGLIRDRAAVTRAVARSHWTASNSVRHAIAFLRSVEVSTPEDEIEEVFRNVERNESDSLDDVDILLELQQIWLGWMGNPDDNTQRALRLRLRAEDEAASEYSKQRDLLRHVQDEIARGRPAEALLAIEEAHDDSYISVELNAARADCWLFLGELEKAVAWSRDCLTVAIGELDQIAIGTYTSCLTEALFMTAYSHGLTTTLTLTLRLGLPGPFVSALPLRALALAAGLQARDGNLDFARLLIGQLESRPPSPDAQTRGLIHWARAEIHFASGEVREANDLLWNFGVEASSVGLAASSMSCWMSIAEVLSKEQFERIDKVYFECELPLFSQAYALHKAIVCGTSTDIVEALALISSELPLSQSRTLLQRINQLRVEEDLQALTLEELASLTGRKGKLHAETSVPQPLEETLSTRELQIAILARTGMTNKDIAAKLYLSIRTVENHLYRALRKLGVTNRQALSSAWDPQTVLGKS